jgi:hypothetical protein
MISFSKQMSEINFIIRKFGQACHTLEWVRPSGRFKITTWGGWVRLKKVITLLTKLWLALLRFRDNNVSGQVESVIVACTKRGVALGTLPLTCDVPSAKAVVAKAMKTLGENSIFAFDFARRTCECLFVFPEMNRIKL